MSITHQKEMILMVALNLKSKKTTAKSAPIAFFCMSLTLFLGETHFYFREDPPPSLQFAQDSTKSEISNFLAAQEALFGGWLSNDSGLLIKGNEVMTWKKS